MYYTHGETLRVLNKEASLVDMNTRDTRFSKQCVPAGEKVNMLIGFVLSNFEFKTPEISRL